MGAILPFIARLNHLCANQQELRPRTGQQSRAAILGEVEHWCRKHTNGDDLVAQFHALGTESDSEAA